ncbi:hypothetical protein THAOC_10516 [Thalassiosira oceanica]|uniref:Uncharacterized protein n=1 Tax=Thalassiosira oceanica TaxID=159749 RepID=K0SSD6_THAOC|nr:hypothetical protein THAOC_10516 [Thalassiosira oceanica]|eukprot:EJK68315.1 hypothetical protein THAOC_10516 [Thalassiosira oceanica]
MDDSRYSSGGRHWSFIAVDGIRRGQNDVKGAHDGLSNVFSSLGSTPVINGGCIRRDWWTSMLTACRWEGSSKFYFLPEVQYNENELVDFTLVVKNIQKDTKSLKGKSAFGGIEIIATKGRCGAQAAKLNDSKGGQIFPLNNGGAAMEDEVAIRVHGVIPLPMGIAREDRCERAGEVGQVGWEAERGAQEGNLGMTASADSTSLASLGQSMNLAGRRALLSSQSTGLNTAIAMFLRGRGSWARGLRIRGNFAEGMKTWERSRRQAQHHWLLLVSLLDYAESSKVMGGMSGLSVVQHSQRIELGEELR